MEMNWNLHLITFIRIGLHYFCSFFIGFGFVFPFGTFHLLLVGARLMSSIIVK